MRRSLAWVAIISLGTVAGVILLAVCACLATWVWGCDLISVTELTRVDAGDNRSVIFYADTCWEVSRSVFYEVQENGQTIIPRTWLGRHFAINYTLKVVPAEDESLIVVYTSVIPDYDAIFVMIDFRSRETWHNGENSQNGPKGLEMFRRLKQANPDLPEPVELLRAMMGVILSREAAKNLYH
jgi:hypothetical protein